MISRFGFGDEWVLFEVPVNTVITVATYAFVFLILGFDQGSIGQRLYFGKLVDTLGTVWTSWKDDLVSCTAFWRWRDFDIRPFRWLDLMVIAYLVVLTGFCDIIRILTIIS